MPEEVLYFVHISDTHIGPTADYARFGHTALPCAKELVKIINELPVGPDFVIHTGDVVADPHPAAYQLAAETFAELNVPIYYVTGNHDSAADIHDYLPMGPKRPTSSDRQTLSYTFEVKGYRFLVLDARAPDHLDPQGLLPEAQLDLVRREASADGPPLTLFLHYPPLPMNSIWMDKHVLIINGESLHQALVPARGRLRGVFYGHIHQPMQTFRDGILYTSAGSSFSQFSGWPHAESTGFDDQHPPSFSFVHLMPGQTIVHQHTFPRPEH